jgi:hypothetical protein
MWGDKNRHGDRWSDDAEDRIEWHVDQNRRWIRRLTVIALAYMAAEVVERALRELF